MMDQRETSTNMAILTHPRRFGRSEDGSALIFSLFIFVLMLMMAGMAVDLMRYETERSMLQNTLDRAILAAADLDQTLDPEDVVIDYFEKSGFGENLNSVTVTEGVNFRTVNAEASANVDTFFMPLVGINELLAPAGGTAEERISDIEISLVLDVSGSMEGDKLANLQDAAQEFVRTMIDDTAQDRTSISIVPYASQVSVGEDILDYFNVSDEHSYSSCVDFSTSDFEATSISRTDLLQRTGHFDASTYSRPPYYWMCNPSSSREILPLSNNVSVLENAIEDFVAIGNTSIEIGMKWGTALLDPGTRSVVTDMVSDGIVENHFEGRPFEYDNPDVLKVVVVMTDGVNTTQYTLNSDYATGNSGVWYDSATGRYSIRYNSDWYYDPDRENWHNEPQGTDPQRLTYPELWNQVSVRYNAYYYYYEMTNSSSVYYDWFYDPRDSVSPTTKNERLDDICNATKGAGIIVFAIGFEVTDASAEIMEDCASTASHFFRVEGLEIGDAFNAIANNISMLRLTL